MTSSEPVRGALAHGPATPVVLARALTTLLAGFAAAAWPSDARADESGYLQWGVALAAEGVVGRGSLCADSTTPCVLGSGGGVAVRVGMRTPRHLYWGGAYELSRQDSSKIYRLAILQQLRAEGRWYFVAGGEVEPYVHFGLGVAGYGNEWGVDTWGPLACAGLGAELQLTRRTALGLAFAYRITRLAPFVDPTGLARGAGVVQLFGLDLALENRQPL